MKRTSLILIALACSAFANPPVGYVKQNNQEMKQPQPTDTVGTWPEAASFDRKWTVRGFTILDAQGNVVFGWDSDPNIVSRDSITISWSPDSKHVVVLDQLWRTGMLFCAELKNDGWVNVPFDTTYQITNDKQSEDPHTPIGLVVEKVTLGRWVSPTEIMITKNCLTQDEDAKTSGKVDYTTAIQFKDGEAMYAK